MLLRCGRAMSPRSTFFSLNGKVTHKKFTRTIYDTKFIRCCTCYSIRYLIRSKYTVGVLNFVSFGNTFKSLQKVDTIEVKYGTWFKKTTVRTNTISCGIAQSSVIAITVPTILPIRIYFYFYFYEFRASRRRPKKSSDKRWELETKKRTRKTDSRVEEVTDWRIVCIPSRSGNDASSSYRPRSSFRYLDHCSRIGIKLNGRCSIYRNAWIRKIRSHSQLATVLVRKIDLHRIARKCGADRFAARFLRGLSCPLASPRRSTLSTGRSTMHVALLDRFVLLRYKRKAVADWNTPWSRCQPVRETSISFIWLPS